MAKMHSVIFVLSFFCVVVNAKLAVFNNCNDVPPDMCTVSEVRITPGTGRSPIQLYTGTNASLSFDFKPGFAASKLKTMAYYQDIPFADLNSDNGCEFTTCPTVPGTQQTLDYNLHLGTKLPKGIYLFQWKVWNEDNKDQQCCFTTSIKLKKNKT